MAEHYRLQPDDPVFLLTAWHWQTVQGSKSKLETISLEFQAALTARAKDLMESADAIAKIGDQLAQVRATLEAKPLSLAKQLEKELAAPVMATAAMMNAAEKALTRAVHTIEKAQRRQTLAGFVIRTVFGASLLAWTL